MTPSQATSFCTDEDVARRCVGDYAVLCPKWQTLAKGADGVFGAGDRWRLSSASVGDWSARGVAPGAIVHLSEPRSRYPGEGWLYAVGAVETTQLVLRGIGLDANDGEPPGPVGGLSAIVFNLPTLAPQIVDASLEAAELYGLDPNVAGRAPTDVYDPNDAMNRFTLLHVLAWLYGSTMRSERGDWAMKAKGYLLELERMKAAHQVKLGATGEDAAPRDLFGTRIYR